MTALLHHQDSGPPVTMADVAALPGFTYLATPYTKYKYGLNCAAFDAARITARLMQRGLKVFSPIAHSHAVSLAGNLDAVDQEMWVEADAPFVEAASSLIVARLEGWNDSYGVSYEIAEFKAAGKPVVFIDPEEI